MPARSRLSSHLRFASRNNVRDFGCGLPPGNDSTLERETGIEPATNSLEGCDSTTELLPPSPQRLKPLALCFRAARLKPCFSRALSLQLHLPPFSFMEPMTRIELVTSPLPRECSTN